MNSQMSFDQLRHAIGAVMGPLCALLIWLIPVSGISESAHHLLAIMWNLPIPCYFCFWVVSCWQRE